MSLDYLHNKTACESSNEQNVKQIQNNASLLKAGFKPTLSLQKYTMINSCHNAIASVTGWKNLLGLTRYIFFISVPFILF